MLTEYDVEVDNSIILNNLSRIQSQIFKLLPMREENKDWQKPLETLAVELLGMHKLLPQLEESLSLVCKLLGLLEDEIKEDFYLYRRTIFECCGLVSKIKEQLL